MVVMMGFRSWAFGVQSEAGHRTSYKSRERFRYALRNEHNLPTKMVDNLVRQLDAEVAAKGLPALT